MTRDAMRSFSLVLLCYAATACALSRSTDGPVHTYVLGPAESAWDGGTQAMPPGIHGVLVVGLPQAEAGFEQPRIAYVQRPYEVNYYATNQWADTPARMLVPLLIHSLESTGLWRAVVPMPTTVRGDYRLDTSGLLLQQEFFRQPSRTRIVLRAQLIDMNEQRVIGARSFEALEPAPSDDAYGGVLAANRAAAQVLHAVEAWISSCLKGSGKSNC
ncbi:MAG: ABC-type transport auxiliary lipoprotein family protein [Nitrospira sp.]|nr:ABC-type transport auxiliary lipoprotein family protein [Nitrospira sp.]